MSASSKKKLRKEQNAQLLTEKQQKAQAEAKKLKITTIAFVAVILAIVVAFAAILTVNLVKNSGVAQKSTVAATIGEHKLNSVEFNYYYNDLISSSYNEWNSMYGDNLATYMMLMGLDLSKPLDEQAYIGGEEEQTWADYFVDSALNRAKSDYALYDAAVAAGHELTEDEKSELDSAKMTMNFYAQLSGYNSIDKYLTAMYGPGASEKSYNAYSERSALATSYYNAHSDSLTYNADQISAYDAEHAADYNGYSFAYYYLNTTKFLGEGTKTEDGGTSYTDEQREAARAAAKAAAESLLNAKTVEELDKAIAALEINKDSTTNVASSKVNNQLGAQIGNSFKDWVIDPARAENDIAVLPYESTSTDADGKETKTVNGYYVVLFQGVKDNVRPVGNVRHLLVKFEGGKTENGTTTYSEKEKEAAKTEAEGYLKTWKEGAATEESFIELVKSKSDDSSASTGGLFEDITPVSNYVTNFRNWAVDENRKVGDTDVIETEYGYHVMYYVGASELNYRQMMISDDIRAEDMETWYNGIVEKATASLVDLKHVDTDKILSAA